MGILKISFRRSDDSSMDYRMWQNGVTVQQMYEATPLEKVEGKSNFGNERICELKGKINYTRILSHGSWIKNSNSVLHVYRNWTVK